MPLSIELLTKRHPIEHFSCGSPPLDSYLKKNALQSIAARLGRTFVALESGRAAVSGYFTMASGAVRFDNFPDHEKHRLPRYPIPTAHLAKLAVDEPAQKKGLGMALLAIAMLQAARASDPIGIFAVDVIALDERARAYYVKFGFVPLLDNPLHLYMGIRKVKAFAELYAKL